MFPCLVFYIFNLIYLVSSLRPSFSSISQSKSPGLSSKRKPDTKKKLSQSLDIEPLKHFKKELENIKIDSADKYLKNKANCLENNVKEKDKIKNSLKFLKNSKNVLNKKILEKTKIDNSINLNFNIKTHNRRKTLDPYINPDLISFNRLLLSTERNLNFINTKRNKYKKLERLDIRPEIAQLHKMRKLKNSHNIKSKIIDQNIEYKKKSYWSDIENKGDEGKSIISEVSSINDQFGSLIFNNSQVEPNTSNYRLWNKNKIEKKYSQLCRSIGHVKGNIKEPNKNDGLIFMTSIPEDKILDSNNN